jgi:hypothetical protein
MEILGDASDTCGDRVALAALHVDLQYRLATFALDDLNGLSNFLIRGIWSMRLLEEYARQIVPTLSFFDEIEVYLGLPIKLKEPLQLPLITDQMLYFQCSNLTEQHLRDAETYVRAYTQNEEACTDFLITQDRWLEALKKRFPEEYTQINQQYERDGKFVPRNDSLKELTLRVLRTEEK